jgi:hypothetical protein
VRAPDFTPAELDALTKLQRGDGRPVFVPSAAFDRLALCLFAERVDVFSRSARKGHVYAKVTDAGRAYPIAEVSDAR